MSTNNICFYGEIMKIIPKYTPYLFHWKACPVFWLAAGGCCVSMTNRVGKWCKTENKCIENNSKIRAQPRR